MALGVNTGMDERRLRWILILFFIALAIPTSLLIYRTYTQIKWEALHQYRVGAEELTDRIDADLRRAIEVEERRTFGDYAFLSVTGDPGATYLQRSPLAAFPVTSPIPGLIGYFQVDSDGVLTSPVVPDSATRYQDYGVNEAEFQRRKALDRRLQSILKAELATPDPRARQPAVAGRTQADDLVDLATADEFGGLFVEDQGVAADRDEAASANVFDRLSSTRNYEINKDIGERAGRADKRKFISKLEEKGLSVAPQAANAPRQRIASKRESRKEQVAVYEMAESIEPAAAPAPARAAEAEVDLASELRRLNRAYEGEQQAAKAATDAPLPVVKKQSRVRFFDGEIDPFKLELLDAEHFVLFRNVWRGGTRFIQGAVIERAAFVDRALLAPFNAAAVAAMGELFIAYDDTVIAGSETREAPPGNRGAGNFRGQLVHRTRLSAPLGGFELVFSVTKLPLGSGTRYLQWVSFVLALVMAGGCYAMYRYGLAQIDIYRQQQDFVSAVSHELKTPLTSIRMYSEMLKAGWADEEKKSSYYAFIHDESERLSRLIANVLQLSRMTRGKNTMDTKTIEVGTLIDMTRSKISSQVEGANFELQLAFNDDALASAIQVDGDAFSQIMINLIDNAIKFTPAGARRRIELGCRRHYDGWIHFVVRDYGRGIPKSQMRKIFELFYRPESELTRETVGTGIGLALVHQLTLAMGGRVDVKNADPGAEFTVRFPAAA